MSQRDISKTIQDIYGFEVSHEMISTITDSVLKKQLYIMPGMLERIEKYT